MEEILQVPDGKFVMPVDVFRKTDVYHNKKRWPNEAVRFTVENGEVTQLNDATMRFYKQDPEGIRLTAGFKFILTVQELKSLSTYLPYSWRV